MKQLLSKVGAFALVGLALLSPSISLTRVMEALAIRCVRRSGPGRNFSESLTIRVESTES